MQVKTQTFKISHMSEYKARQTHSIKNRLPEFTRLRLSKPIKTMLDEADDTLFDFSNKAGSNLSQQAYFDAMREVRINRNSIEHGFLNTIDHAFNIFSENKNITELIKTENSQTEELLELVDEQSMEEEIAIHNMADKQERRFQRDIFEIKSRVKAIYQCHDDSVEIHPLSPITIVNAFASALQSLDIEFHVKLIIFKLFDKFVMSSIGDTYREINALLISEKILPNLAYQFKRTHNRSPAQVPSEYQNNGSPDPVSTQQHDWDTVENINDSSTGSSSRYHQQSTESLLPTDFGLHGFIPIPSQSSGVIGTLSDMQNHISHKDYPIDVSPKQMGLQIINGIQKMGFSSVKGKRELDENIINMVSLVFDFILDDRTISDHIKSQFSKLQIPFLKLALVDDSFLSNKKHPARQLLNAMATASIGWTATQGEDNLYSEIESTVENILKNFDQDIGLFENLLSHFQHFCATERKFNITHEERTWKTTEGKERVEYAKKRVDSWIHMWCTQDGIRQQVSTFLKHFWKNTMLYCMHKYGEDSQEWQYYIKLINTLIWSTTCGKNTDDVKQLIKITPILIRGLNRGLLTTGTHPKTISNIFNEFSKCHMDIIEKGLKNPSKKSETELATSHSNEQSESQQQNNTRHVIESIYAKSNSDDNVKPELEIDRSLEALGNDVIPVAVKPEQESEQKITLEDAHFQQASNIQYGDWLEFIIDNKLVAAKLAWKSNISKSHLFVGRNGMRIAEKSLSEIADELRDGIASFIDKAPLIDRALSALDKNKETL